MPAAPIEVRLAADLPAISADAKVGPAWIDLLFDQPAATDANLVFGAGYQPPRHDLTLRAALPAPVVSARFIPPARAELQAALPVPTVRSLILRPSVPVELGSPIASPLPGVAFLAEVAYASRTQRPTVGQTVHPWQVTQRIVDGAAPGHEDTAATPAGWTTLWRRTQGLPQGVAHRLPPALTPAVQQRSAGHDQATPLRQATGFAHQGATPQRLWRRGGFEGASLRRDATRFRHQDGDRTRRAARSAPWQGAARRNLGQGSGFTDASAAPRGWRGRYQEAIPPPPGITVRVVPEPPAVPSCYDPSPHLLFVALSPASIHLRFVCDSGIDPPPPDPEDRDPVVIPIRRIYLVMNDVSLRRLPEGTPVPVFSLSLSIDTASWAWGFEAQMPATAEPLVATSNGPVDLLASVNGTDFRVLAENISRERTFGESSIRVSGRGHNAALAAPYAPVMTFTNLQVRSARQLMEDVLTNDGTATGVSLGWTVDWALTDWNVPAGVFSRQGTRLEALTAIASAAGAYLLPHPAEPRIRVRHRYPTAPWQWSERTPDVVLPAEAVMRESLQWREWPAYNRVFVSGQEAGVLAQVSRAGSAGDVLAPMVVDPLITEAAAARQRGLAVLGATGRQIEASLKVPVFESTGLIEPGAFVEYRDGALSRIGLVRSTRLEAQLPQVWQTLGIQAYA